MGIWMVVLRRGWMGLHRGIIGDDAWLSGDIVTLCPGDLV